MNTTNSNKKNAEMSCKICNHYSKKTKICLINKTYIPLIGYSYWKYCDNFHYVNLIDDPNIEKNINNIYNHLPFSDTFKKDLISNPSLEYIVKDRLTELLYTGLEDEQTRMHFVYPTPDIIKDTEKKNLEYIKEHYDKYPDISSQQKNEIERYLKNIIVISLEKQIPFNKLFSSVNKLLKQSIYNRRYNDDHHLNRYDILFSKNYPFYSLLFISEVKKILNCAYDDIFEMTDEERTKRLIALFGTRIKFDFLGTDDFDIDTTPDDLFSDYDANNEIFTLQGYRSFNKEKNKFEFSIVFEPVNFLAFAYESLGTVTLYSETDNGPLISMFLKAYDIEDEIDYDFD